MSTAYEQSRHPYGVVYTFNYKAWRDCAMTVIRRVIRCIRAAAQEGAGALLLRLFTSQYSCEQKLRCAEGLGRSCSARDFCHWVCFIVYVQSPPLAGIAVLKSFATLCNLSIFVPVNGLRKELRNITAARWARSMSRFVDHRMAGVAERVARCGGAPTRYGA